MDFIDTHLHLIARDKLGYAWTAGIPALAEGDFTLADYTALIAGRGVVGTVFMETGVDDADYQAEARLVATDSALKRATRQQRQQRPRA